MATYDYIVVGAGAAGCVLAARLTENPAVSVLLLEAGGKDSSPFLHIPAAFSRLFRTAADWNYEAEGALDGQTQYWPRGKVLGGSDSLNAMMYVRGHAWDYDHWAALGCAGWGYEDVLPYFRRIENSHLDDAPSLGAGGPMHISRPRAFNALSGKFLAAGQSLGLPLNRDYNGKAQDGVAVTALKQHGGRRWSAADGYLRPALSRKNLHVVTHGHALRVTIAEGRATGVVYQQDGQTVQASASREVLLCGGAINSPQLLMLSGIGPAAHLRAQGIDVAVDAPDVGQNLQDHPASGSSYACTQPISLANAEKLPALLRYMVRRNGPLTSNVAEAIAFIRTRENLPAPDIEILFAPSYFMYHGFRSPKGHGYTLGAVLLRPKSRGQITLASPDPLAAPLIQPRYFSDADDLETMLAGVKFTRKLANAAPFDPYRGEEVAPGASLTEDDALKAYILQEFQSLYHPVGTCRMGADAASVVDAQLRVRGVDGLRVVDASVMPTLIGGHTVAPALMIAEKAADLLKA